MLESKDIANYLLRTYKTGEPINETWLDFDIDTKKNV